MFRGVLFACIFVSFTGQGYGLDSSKKPKDGDVGCGGYFLRQMFHLFSDEKMDNKIQRAIMKLKEEFGPTGNHKQVAFTAGLATSKTYSGGKTIEFTKAITNVGGGLNTTDGIFYCPEPGLYSFFVNMMTTRNDGYVQIYKNDQFIMSVFTDQSGSGWKSGSNQVILQLKKGDKASVKSHGTNNLHSNASHFSGHKL